MSPAQRDWRTSCPGLDSTASPLPSERDQNFLLTPGRATGSSSRSPMRPKRADARCAERGDGTRPALGLCPRVVSTTDGLRVVRAPSGHFVRLLSWLPGSPWGRARQSRFAARRSRRRLGQLSAAMADFDHPAIHREFYWDLSRGFEIIREHAPLIADPSLRGFVRRTSGYIESRDGRRLATLRRTAIHGDANDYNVLVVETPGCAASERPDRLRRHRPQLRGRRARDRNRLRRPRSADPLGAASPSCAATSSHR